MKRLEYITLLVAVAGVWPLSCLAQQRALPVVGFLNSASADGYAGMAEAFRQGLKETGYVEGQNVTIEYRWANNAYDRLPALAADLVERQVTVIVANSPSIAPAKAATKTIPIAFLSGDDPVRLGFVASLAKPGGNATGVTIFSGELAAKRLDLLRELIPQAKTVAVLINTGWPATARFRADVEAAANAMALPLQFLQANNESEIDDAFDSLRADALLVGPGPFYDSRRDKLVALAAKARVPAAYEFSRNRGRWWFDKLWSKRSRRISASWRVHWPGSQRRKAGRYARNAAYEIRVRHQPSDRQDARRYRAGQSPRYC